MQNISGAIIDDRLSDGRLIQLLMYRIAVNPVTGDAAVIIVVLSISEPESQDSLTYNYIARSLSEDYITLFFVDMDNDTYTEYSSDGEHRDLSLEKKGEDFFDFNKADFNPPIVDEDKDLFKKQFTKEIVAGELEKNGIYSIVTRMLIDGNPTFVTVKAVKVRGKGKHTIIGINNVDAQIKTVGVYEHHHSIRYKGSYIHVTMKAVLDKEEEDKLIVGILDIDEIVKREQEYAANLQKAETKALKLPTAT